MLATLFILSQIFFNPTHMKKVTSVTPSRGSRTTTTASTMAINGHVSAALSHLDTSTALSVFEASSTTNKYHSLAASVSSSTVMQRNLTRLTLAGGNATATTAVLSDASDQRLANAIFVPSILAIGLFGNLFIVLVVLFTRTIHGKSRAYMFALALTDTVFLVSGTLPNAIRYVAGTPIWLLPDFFCNVFIVSSFASTNSSALIILCFSIERCLAVSFPFKARLLLTQRRQVIAIAVCTIVPTIYSHLWLFHVGITKSYRCSYIYPNSSFVSILRTIDLVAFFVIPIFGMVITNAITIYKIATVGFTDVQASQHKKANPSMSDMMQNIVAGTGGIARLPLHVAKSTQSTVSTSRRLGEPRNPNSTMSRESQAATVMLVTVAILFVLLTMPYRLFTLINSLYQEKGHSPTNSTFRDWTSHVTRWLLYINAAVNPIIYYAMSRRFRDCVKQIMQCKLERPADFLRWNDGASTVPNNRRKKVDGGVARGQQGRRPSHLTLAGSNTGRTHRGVSFQDSNNTLIDHEDGGRGAMRRFRTSTGTSTRATSRVATPSCGGDMFLMPLQNQLSQATSPIVADEAEENKQESTKLVELTKVEEAPETTTCNVALSAGVPIPAATATATATASAVVPILNQIVRKSIDKVTDWLSRQDSGVCEPSSVASSASNQMLSLTSTKCCGIGSGLEPKGTGTTNRSSGGRIWKKKIPEQQEIDATAVGTEQSSTKQERRLSPQSDLLRLPRSISLAVSIRLFDKAQPQPSQQTATTSSIDG